jgi:hypothetical protein
VSESIRKAAALSIAQLGVAALLHLGHLTSRPAGYRIRPTWPFSPDFLTVPEDQIMNIKSYMTIVDGSVVYEAQPAR